MKVAALQLPLDACNRSRAIALIRDEVTECERLGVRLLCCPEAILGGLADQAADPRAIAIHAARGDLAALLAPLASDHVAVIIGFTEIDDTGTLYNSAALMLGGQMAGLYRKLHPAIRRSVYAPGTETPVFRLPGLTFGIVICYDSTFNAPARAMAEAGATLLCVPTNTALPADRDLDGVLNDARRCDAALATANGIMVVRADVEGSLGSLEAVGASQIVDRSGRTVRRALPGERGLLVAEVNPDPAILSPSP